LIADHLALAGRSLEAIEYLLEAGDRARGLYAHQEAINAYERALALLKEQGDDEQAARTLMTLGLTYHTAFDFRRSRQAYEEGFTLWQRAAETQRLPVSPLPPAPHALRLAWTEPPTLDPGLSNDTASGLVIDQLFSGLVDHTPELGIVPDVAASWEILDGGRRYLFRLRDDVVWSDGTPVTAHDFEYAWKRVLDAATESTCASQLYDLVGARAYHQGQVPDPDTVGVRALDEATLTVELERPVGYLLHLLAYAATWPVPRHVVEQRGAAWTDPESLVTNGPFTLESWRPGSSMVVVRNPRYHGGGGGNVERVELTLFPSRARATELPLYEADSLDIFELDALAPEEADRIRRLHGAEYVSLPGATSYYVAFDVRDPPFDDPRVRRAFAHAVDRETLAGVTLGGYYAPATGGFVPPGMPGHAPGIALPYNPETARELLVDAGYPGGEGFPTVDFVTHLRHRAVSKHLYAQWQENLGVQLRWSEMPWAEFLDKVHSDPPHLFFIGWVADYPDPDSFLRVAVQLHTAWRSQRYLALVDEAGQATDQAERMKLYAEVERLLAEEVPLLPLTYERAHLLLKPWLRRYPVSVSGDQHWKDVIIEPH
jgi:oligopeptide transport system substrate-binding protein